MVSRFLRFSLFLFCDGGVLEDMPGKSFFVFSGADNFERPSLLDGSRALIFYRRGFSVCLWSFADGSRKVPDAILYNTSSPSIP